MKNKVLIFGLCFVFFIAGRTSVRKVSLLDVPVSTSNLEEGDIASIEGKVLTEYDLPKELSARLYQIRMQEYEILTKQFKNYAFDFFVDAESLKIKKSRRDYLKSILSYVKEPPLSDVEEFSKKYNIDTKKDPSLVEKIRSKLKEDLLEREKDTFVSSFIGKKETKVFFEKPRVFLSDRSLGPKIGDSDSKNKIILFRDLATSGGKRLTDLAESLSKKGKVHLSYRDFSSIRAQDGDYRVQAQLCANELLGLEKYKEISLKLAAKSEKKEIEDVLSDKNLIDCVRSNRYQLEARSNLVQVLSVGSSGKSAVIINGTVILEDAHQDVEKYLVK